MLLPSGLRNLRESGVALASWRIAVSFAGGIASWNLPRREGASILHRTYLGCPFTELNWKPEDFDVIHKSAAWEQRSRRRKEESGFGEANESHLAQGYRFFQSI